MKQITIDQLEPLALGAAILGSGGGGATTYNRLITQHMLETYGPVHVMQVDELKPTDCVVPIAFMGAPLVGMEKIPSGKEIQGLFKALEMLGKKPTVLMSGEIGGANAFTPLWAAAKLGLPVLDADLIGRAFPELQMTSCTLKGVDCNPAILCDCLGNTVVIQGQNSATMERIARHATIAMGSRAGVAMYIMSGTTAKDTVVPQTLSGAIAIGKALLNARTEKRDPCEAILTHTGGIKLGTGIITDIDHQVAGGFLKGSIFITTPRGNIIQVHTQNEYLLATQNEEVLASTPDLIMLLEQEKGTPIPSANVQYGLRVDLIALPAPEIWTTEAGLKLAGPHYFNYNTPFTSIRRNR